MTTLVKTRIEGRHLTLPPRISRGWADSDVQIHESGDRLIVEQINAWRQGEALRRWKKLSGMLAGRKIPNPIQWQRSIRKEWERKAA